MKKKLEGYQDYPFDKMCEQVDKLINQGHEVWQKFTCVGCGQRLTMDEPNKFFEQGTCDKCPAITDIKKQGCNYMMRMVFGVGSPAEK